MRCRTPGKAISLSQKLFSQKAKKGVDKNALPCYNIKVRNTAPWPSGQARVCKTLIPGPNPGGASKERSTPIGVLFSFFGGAPARRIAFSCATRKETGSVTPPKGRGACTPDAGRGYFRAKREWRVAPGRRGSRPYPSTCPALTSRQVYVILNSERRRII